MERIIRHFKRKFDEANQKRKGPRRAGAELKFPFVNARGEAGSHEGILALWKFLEQKGWDPSIDPVSSNVIGASTPGPLNDSLASCETGFCKTEFSLAHVADLHELDAMVKKLREMLREFSERSGDMFLGFGIQPVTPPGKHLEMKKSRNIFWDKVFGSNRHIAPEDGDDVHLFTISASSQVHVDVTREEAVRAVNVFNGFSGAQIALTANSNIWKGRLDPELKCAGEMFWDWWIPGTDRFGVPPAPFADLDDYVRTVAMLPPVYVRRNGVPHGIFDYDSFYEYFSSGDEARALDPDGKRVVIRPDPADIEQHGSFYWYNARISRYYTLENRVCDQQPPDDILCIAALTMGLMSALDEATEEVGSHDWDTLRQARKEACARGMQAKVGDLEVADLAGRMLAIAEEGLARRGLGESKYLSPLKRRLAERRCPADEAEKIFEQGGLQALLEKRRI